MGTFISILLIVISAILVLCAITALLRLRVAVNRVNAAIARVKSLESELVTTSSDLRVEREKYSALISGINTSVVLLNKEKHLLLLNKSAEQLFEIPKGIWLEKPFITLAHDYEINNVVERCLNTSERQTGVIQLVNSKQHNVELTAIPISIGVLLLIEDTTNIRRLEKVRQDFVANISHELRTPITSIKAMVETLQNGAIKDKNIARDFLSRMQVEAEKLAQMVAELNELSRIENGDLPLVMKPVNIESLITRVTERLRPQWERAQQKVTVNYVTNLPQISGDENRLEQVLVNILHNAIKFSPRDGSIILGAKSENDHVIITISDTGIGIPAEDLGRVFERFYKVDKARSGGGTGLGLAIAKHIVKAHRGEIIVESAEGQGSTFTISLPRSLS